MTITIGFWVLPVFANILSFLWICYGFNYRGDYNFTPVFTVPMLAFLVTLAWLIYFATIYFLGARA